MRTRYPLVPGKDETISSLLLACATARGGLHCGRGGDGDKGHTPPPRLQCPLDAPPPDDSNALRRP